MKSAVARRAVWMIGAAFLLLLPWAARAVIVSGDQSGHDDGAGAGGGWAYVGTCGGASGIYLGQYNGQSWVLTAHHVGAGTFTLAGTAYPYITNSYLRIAGVDLGVFRIEGNPGLPNLTLASTTPSVGSAVTMIGYGRNRAADLTTWYVDVDTNPWTWREYWFPGADATADGYKWALGNTKRWGTNTVAGTAFIDYGYGALQSLYTIFDKQQGEAQGAPGDSGGGVFYYDGSTIQLVGLMVTISGYSGQPHGTAVHGNATYSVDIATYRSEILAVIPEPSAAVLAVLGIGLLWRIRLRQCAMLRR